MNPLTNVDRTHMRKVGRKFLCTICGFQGYQYREFDVHSETCHSCRGCGNIFRDLGTHNCPRRLQGGQHRDNNDHDEIQPGAFLPENLTTGKFKLVQQAHLGTIVRFLHKFIINYVYIESGVDYLYDDLVALIRQMLAKFQNVKIMFKIVVKMFEKTSGEERDIPTASPYISVLHENFIDSCIHFSVDYIINTINLFHEEKSGFSVVRLETFEVEFGQLRVIPGRGYIPTPKSLSRLHSLLNIKTSINNCFLVSVLAHFFRQRIRLPNKPRLDFEQMNRYEREQLKRRQENPLNYYDFRERAIRKYNLDFSGFEEDVSIEDLDEFEVINPNVSINVYGYDHQNNNFSPWRLSKKDCEHHINLLLLTISTLPISEHLSKWGRFPPERHYVLIHDLSLLLSKDRTKSEHCKWCLRRVGQNSPHGEKCRQMHEAKLKLYPEGTKFKFKNLYMKFDTMYRVYFDLETYNMKYHSCEPQVNPSKLSYTRAEANMVVAAFGLSLVGHEGNIIYQRYYCEDNVMEVFLETLFKIEEEVMKRLYNDILPCNPTPDEIKAFKVATLCYECRHPFTAKNHKVLHHHHYIKDHPVIPLCNECNLQITHKKILPVISHYGVGFDILFVIKALTSKIQKKVRIIAKNGEKFMSISIGSLRFLDSCLFLNASLDKLVLRLKGEGTPEEMERFKYFKEGFDNHQHVDMLIMKQFFPYDFLDSPVKLIYTSLPSQAEFYNSLNEEHITDEQYQHAQLVWKRFNCKTFQDYLLLYLKTDVLLLQVVFEHFVKTCHRIYGLSPVFCYSTPGYAYNASMYYEKQDWEFPADLSMVELIKQNIRGGLCYATTRYSRANTESLNDVGVDDSQRKEILYLDFNSLYGSQLMEPMPHSEYEWLTESDLKSIDISKLPENTGRGWIFEVDLSYGKHLHDLDNYMPLAPHRMTVDRMSLSQHQQYLLDKYSEQISNPIGGESLLLTLYDKSKYAVYYRLLKFYIDHGLVVTKIHRGFTFVEKPIFKKFIRKNIELRKEATDEFSRSLYKIIVNSIYGKTLHLQPYTTTRFCNSRVECLHLLAAHNFKSVKIINDDVSLFFLDGGSTLVSKPFFCGFVTLELSKLLMYTTYYDIILKKFGNNVRNLYSDTDSYILEFKDPGKTLYDDLKSIGKHFDFSTIDKKHTLYCDKNKGIEGKLKLEFINIRECVCLKSKMYSLLLQCTRCHEGVVESSESDFCEGCRNKEVHEIKCKGVPKKALKKICHQTFVDALNTNNITYIESRSIRARNCELEIIHSKKIAVHNLYIKRWLKADNINTFALGHYKIDEQ